MPGRHASALLILLCLCPSAALAATKSPAEQHRELTAWLVSVTQPLIGEFIRQASQYADYRSAGQPSPFADLLNGARRKLAGSSGYLKASDLRLPSNPVLPAGDRTLRSLVQGMLTGDAWIGRWTNHYDSEGDSGRYVSSRELEPRWMSDVMSVARTPGFENVHFATSVSNLQRQTLEAAGLGAASAELKLAKEGRLNGIEARVTVDRTPAGQGAEVGAIGLFLEGEAVADRRATRQRSVKTPRTRLGVEGIIQVDANAPLEGRYRVSLSFLLPKGARFFGAEKGSARPRGGRSTPIHRVRPPRRTLDLKGPHHQLKLPL